jgi:rhamnogalacturonyl hydrolase YesR
MLSRRALCLTPALALHAAQRPRILTVDLTTGGPYSFPPQGKAYRENAAAHRLWRRIHMEAPDLLVLPSGQDFGLQSIGIPIVKSAPKSAPPSALHTLQSQRMAQPPQAWSSQLAGQYGQALKEMVYTLSFSVWGRLRAGQTEAVKPILEPFLDGRINSLAKPTASHFSGHLTLAAFHEITGDPRAKIRVLAAANIARETPMDNEMSDAVFMVCPLLAKAARFAGDKTYAEAALAHFEKMRKLCLRPDGLYRHSPLDEAAWGRGNAFPLLGLALTLSDLPNPTLLEAYVQHANSLLSHQTPGGCWRQVIDKPEAWEEFTATAMIGWALRRGLTRQWIKGKKYQAAVTSAWQAIQRRTLADGTLIDVCESTGKQKSLADYYNREALMAIDPRGGAMALQFAAEMATA